MRTGWRQSTIGQLQPSSLRDSSQSNDRTTLELDGQLIEAGNSALSVGFGSYQTLTVARASICMHVYARLGSLWWLRPFEHLYSRADSANNGRLRTGDRVRESAKAGAWSRRSRTSTHSMSRIIQIERHTYIQLVEQHMLKLAKALNLRPPTRPPPNTNAIMRQMTVLLDICYFEQSPDSL